MTGWVQGASGTRAFRWSAGLGLQTLALDAGMTGSRAFGVNNTGVAAGWSDATGPIFVEVPAPSDEAPQTVLHKIITRIVKLRTRRGELVEEQGSTYMADNDATRTPFTNCGKSAPTAASVSAKKVAACCCTRRYRVVSSGRWRSSWIGCNIRRPAGLPTDGLHALLPSL